MSKDLPAADIDSNDAPPHRRPGEFGSMNLIQVVCGVLVGIVVILLLAVAIIRQSRKAALVEATSNMKSQYYLLMEFDQDYGQFPCDATAVGKLAGYRSDHYSNEYLAQLHGAGLTMSEIVFFTKGVTALKGRPDNAAPWLDAGECSYAYIVGLSSKSRGDTPVVLVPMRYGGEEFVPGLYGNKAAYLRVDGSVRQCELNAENKAVIGGGKMLFDGGAGTVWGEKGFDLSRLKYPK